MPLRRRPSRLILGDAGRIPEVGGAPSPHFGGAAVLEELAAGSVLACWGARRRRRLRWPPRDQARLASVDERHRQVGKCPWSVGVLALLIASDVGRPVAVFDLRALARDRCVEGAVPARGLVVSCGRCASRDQAAGRAKQLARMPSPRAKASSEGKGRGIGAGAATVRVSIGIRSVPSPRLAASSPNRGIGRSGSRDLQGGRALASGAGFELTRDGRSLQPLTARHQVDHSSDGRPDSIYRQTCRAVEPRVTSRPVHASSDGSKVFITFIPGASADSDRSPPHGSIEPARRYLNLRRNSGMRRE